VHTLISLALSTLIVMSAIQWFQVSKKAALTTHKKQRNLDVIRTVLHFLKNDLKTSGYLGCRTLDDSFSINQVFVDYLSPYKFWHKDRNVFGFYASPGVCISQMPSSLCERIKDNSEVLVIYNIAQNRVKLKQAMTKSDDAVHTLQKKAVRKKSMVLISDCLQADIFIANEVENERIFHHRTLGTNLTDQLSKNYATDAEVSEIQTVAYYLGTPPRQKSREQNSQTSQKSYSLYRDDLNNKAVEIVEGISDLQVEYGFYVPASGIQYRTAATMTNATWPLVQSIRLKITVDNQVWRYEFAIGNWAGTRLSAYFINCHFNDICTPSVASNFRG
jgi:Tfp pilus assembly protein PilW